MCSIAKLRGEVSCIRAIAAYVQAGRDSSQVTGYRLFPASLSISRFNAFDLISQSFPLSYSVISAVISVHTLLIVNSARRRLAGALGSDVLILIVGQSNTSLASRNTETSIVDLLQGEEAIAYRFSNVRGNQCLSVRVELTGQRGRLAWPGDRGYRRRSSQCRRR